MKSSTFCDTMIVIFYSYKWHMGVEGMSGIIIDKWINIEETAEYLGVKPVTVRSWIKKDNGIPAHKIGKLWKFKKKELDAWVKSGKSAIE